MSNWMMSNWMHHQIRELYDPSIKGEAFEQLVEQVRRVDGQEGVDFLMSLAEPEKEDADTGERGYRWIVGIRAVKLLVGTRPRYQCDGVLVDGSGVATAFRGEQPEFTTHISNMVIYHNDDAI